MNFFTKIWRGLGAKRDAQLRQIAREEIVNLVVPQAVKAVDKATHSQVGDIAAMLLVPTPSDAAQANAAIDSTPAP